jgi:2-polyprenyl-6-methoxyphenol hydroxylase-like FAD-dependent oxidoreductase
VADVPNFFRKPYGPGWALVGDAGHHKDPYLALGVCDAFRDADLLAEALDEVLAGRRPIEAAMADYERRRNEAAMAEYRLNLHLARFKPLPPGAQQLRSALRRKGDQEDINRFYLANQGLVPRETFFNPDNLRRILAAA